MSPRLAARVVWQNISEVHIMMGSAQQKGTGQAGMACFRSLSPCEVWKNVMITVLCVAATMFFSVGTWHIFWAKSFIEKEAAPVWRQGFQNWDVVSTGFNNLTTTVQPFVHKFPDLVDSARQSVENMERMNQEMVGMGLSIRYMSGDINHMARTMPGQMGLMNRNVNQMNPMNMFSPFR